ncbi:MAG TPA: laccase domain-containing protein, partial [Alphaproteobacteria bacterium]
MPQPSVKSKLIDTPHGFYGRDGIPETIKPVLLKQVHGDVCVTITDFRDDMPEADALVTTNPNITLAIKTADCAPVLFSAPGVIGAAHAGWGGALKGVLESTIAEMEKLGADRNDITAAVGPCIAQKS